FILSLGAGVVVGMVVSHPGAIAGKPATQPSPGRDGRNPMAVDLGLTPQQDEAIQKIWSEARAAMRQVDGARFERRHALNEERDKAVLLLIAPEKKADYDRIQQEHATKIAELNKERDHIFQDAEQKMKAVLTDAQWKRFEEKKREHMEH